MLVGVVLVLVCSSHSLAFALGFARSLLCLMASALGWWRRTRIRRRCAGAGGVGLFVVLTGTGVLFVCSSDLLVGC